MDRNLLNRATDSSDAPTPGYLYLDIAKNAASSPLACQEMAAFLSRKLQNKSNPNIKMKCLKVIAKTASSANTRGMFGRAMSQDPSNIGAVKEALNFRGPMDPARGDAPNQAVRTAAKEALDAIYSEAPSSSSSVMGGVGGSMGGVGSGGGMPGIGGGGVSSSYAPSPYAGGGYGGSSSAMGGGGGGGGPRKMEGIGNPRFKDPRLEGPERGISEMTIGEIAREAGDTIVGMIKDPLARNVEVGPSSSSSMPGFGSNSGGYNPRASGGYSGPPPGRNQMISQTGGQWTMASNRGPNAYGGPSAAGAAAPPASSPYSGTPSGASASGGGVGGSWGSAAPSIASQARAPPHVPVGTPYIGVTPSTTTTTNTSGAGGTAVSDGSFEANLIKELCPPGGMKAEPPPDKLARFATAVPSLNADLICPALLDSLEDGNPWMMRAKALWVIQTAIEKGGGMYGGGANPYLDFFYACRGEIEPLANHPRHQIKTPARKCLQLMGLDIPAAAGSTTTAAGAAPKRRTTATASAPPPPPPADLLDFGAVTAPAPPPAVAPPVPPPAAAPPAPPASTAVPSTSSGGDLFGGLSIAGASALTPAAAPPPPPPATAAASLLDMGVTPAAPAAPVAASSTTSGSMFGDLTVKEDTSATAPPPPPPPESPAAPTTAATDAMPPGSAFSFMNAGAAPVAAGVPPSPSPVKEKPVFDPLLMPEGARQGPNATNPLTGLAQPSPNTMKQMMATLTPAQLQAMYMQQQMLTQQAAMVQAQMQMAAMMQQQQRPGSAVITTRKKGVGGSNPNIMQNNTSFAASTSFNFLDDPPGTPSQKQKKEDAKFDFIQDALKNEKK